MEEAVVAPGSCLSFSFPFPLVFLLFFAAREYVLQATALALALVNAGRYAYALRLNSLHVFLNNSFSSTVSFQHSMVNKVSFARRSVSVCVPLVLNTCTKCCKDCSTKDMSRGCSLKSFMRSSTICFGSTELCLMALVMALRTRV